MEPLQVFEKIQPLLKVEIDNAIKSFASDKRYSVADIPAHTHNGTDSNPVDFSVVSNRTRFALYRIVDADIDTAVDTTVGGDFVMPFNGYITAVGATVDTAGTTGTTDIDFLVNGVSVLTTKVTIDSGEKTSRTAATPSVLNTQYNSASATSYINFVTGDIFTFDIDAVSTTPAKGCTVFINIIET